jgi:hypothetical protein
VKGEAPLEKKFQDLFQECVRLIENAYKRLGYQLGWRFLYTPESTLSSKTRMVFMGLNPGGDSFYPPAPSVERGNAFRVEKWPGNGPSHQREVQNLFHKIAMTSAYPGGGAALMDEALASNFCPFRSPSWDALPKKKEAIQLSNQLWGEIFGQIMPSVLILNGNSHLQYLIDLFLSMDCHILESKELLTGWGNIKARQLRMESRRGSILIMQLPNLARFKIMSSAKCEKQSGIIARTVAAELKSHNGGI